MFSHPNPSLTARVCPIQPATIHINHKQLRIEEKRGQWPRLVTTVIFLGTFPKKRISIA